MKPRRDGERRNAPGARSSRAVDVCVALLLVAAIAAAYSAVRGHGFVNFDDPEYVVDNRHVATGLTAENVAWAFSAVHSANWHPLTWLSHMLDCELFGLDPGPHHATNVLLHALAAVLLYGALRSLTGAVWPSALVAALFALHPRNVESVAWISERKDVLSAVFWTGAMWAYAGYARRPTAGRYLGFALLFALGLLAKPMLVTFPFALLLLDVWPLGRTAWAPAASGRAAAPRSPRDLVLEKLPLIALSIASSVVTFEAQRRSGAMATIAALPVATRFENAAVGYATYLCKTLWPTHLAAFYPYRMEIPAGEVALSVVLLATISAVAVVLARTRPYVLIGWLWYLGTLIPVIGLVRVGDQAMADRFTYLPLIGIYVAVAWGMADLAALRPRLARPLAGVAVAALVACAWATRAQAALWRDSIALFEHALSVTRDNHVAEKNLSIALLEAGRVPEALDHARNAVRLRPEDGESLVNLGAALAKQGDDDGAREAYAAALRLDPNDAMAHLNLGVLAADRERWDEALRHYDDAQRIDPDRAKAHAGVGWVLIRQGRIEAAVPRLRRALELDPRLSATANSLALALDDLGRRDEALAVWDAAIRRDPGEPRLRSNYADALAASGRTEDAISQLRAARAAAAARGQADLAASLDARLHALGGAPAAP